MRKVFSREGAGTGAFHRGSLSAIHAGYGRYDMTGGVAAKYQAAQRAGGLAAPRPSK